MSAADGRKRELANYIIEQKPVKRTANTKSAGGRSSASKNAASRNTGAKNAASGTKQRPAASKKTAAAQPKPRRASSRRVEENPLARRDSVVYAEAPRREPYAGRRPDRRSARPMPDAMFMDEPRRAAKPAPSAGQQPHRRRRKKRSPFSPATLLLLLLIGGLAGMGVWRVNEYEVFQQMKAVVARQTFYEGTTVEGVNVSAMTLSEAINHWDQQIEPAYRERAAVLNDGTRITAAQLGYSSDYVNTLSAAWNAGRTGSLVERYRRATLHMQSPKAYEVSRSFYDSAVVESYAAQLAGQIDAQPQDAKLNGFDTASLSFSYSAEQLGRSLNQQKLVNDIEAALSSGGGNVQLEVATIQPSLTQQDIAASYGRITSAVTDASSSSKNRLNNIALALQLINGTALQPGESFSFNEVVGKRTKDRGFKTAPAYSSGTVTEEVGGGICQVSTTLFNAAVKADLEINERHAHSLTVSYVDPGKDAAVDWGNKDLRFTNSGSDTVYIYCELTSDKQVYVAVYGRLLENGMYITVEGQKTGSVEPETQYQVNFLLASGQEKVIQKGKKGSKASAYKIWWDASGNELKRELLCKSSYRATPKIIERGP